VVRSDFMIGRPPGAGAEADEHAEADEGTRTLDDAAFRVFYQRHARAVWSYLYRAVGNAAQADDVMQEAFCRFLTAPVAGLAEAEQRAYVFRIASNLAIDHWRRSRREQPATAGSGGRGDEAGSREPQEPSAPGTQPTPREMDVAKTLGELKPRERALLWLAYVEESGHDEIAASLGLAPKSVRVLLFRARRKLASLLRQRGISHGGAETR
jgi:RNA polymerase sigma-70 factor (ECF subfamily)